MTDYSQDYLLDKQIKIFQPLQGYRAAIDAVLLAASVIRVQPGQAILDVGSGTGAVSLCLAARFRAEAPQITGLELQSELAELSNHSAKANGFDTVRFLHQDIRDCKLTRNVFRQVITNPPYSERDLPSPEPGKSAAHHFVSGDLAEWLDFCLKMLAPKGRFYMINRASALQPALALLEDRLGAVEVIPVFSKSGQPAKRVIIRGIKGSKTPLALLPGLIMHNPKGGYTEEAEAILRAGAPLYPQK